MGNATQEPEYYVNGPPQGSSKDTDRCQHLFEELSKEPWHEVEGKHCRLPGAQVQPVILQQPNGSTTTAQKTTA